MKLSDCHNVEAHAQLDMIDNKVRYICSKCGFACTVHDEKDAPTKKDALVGFASLDIIKLRDEMDRIASDWNGKDATYSSGGDPYTEEQAGAAFEIAELCEEIAELLKLF